MKDDDISRIEIRSDGRLCLWPVETRFDQIFRSGMEVHWDREEKFLYSPKPREWSYLRWFEQIVAAAKSEYGIRLRTTPTTDWANIESDLKQEILAFQERC